MTAFAAILSVSPERSFASKEDVAAVSSGAARAVSGEFVLSMTRQALCKMIQGV
jgi:hypothetical protein